MGNPELRCDDADYGRDWYYYNDYPWWNRSDPYFYGSYNYGGWDQRCPAYYYYDHSSGDCRYYTGYSGNQDSWWWNSSSVSGESAAQASHPRRSRSAGVPSRTGNSAVPLNKSSSAQSGSGSSSGGVHVRPRSVVPIQRGENTISETPVVKELPKEQIGEQPRPAEQPRDMDVRPAPEQQAVQQAPPPPPPSQSTPSGSNQPDQNQNSDNSSHDRHNPRSW